MSHHRQVEPSEVFGQLLRDNVLVTRYQRPKRYGSLVLPDEWQEDTSQTLWEIVQASDGAEEALGQRLGPGDILQTRRRFPVDTGMEDPEGRVLFILSIEGNGVMGVTKNTWDKEQRDAAED